MQIFTVSDDCFELGLRSGAILFRDLKIESASSDLQAQLDVEAQRVGDRFESLVNVRAAPELTAGQDILRRVGVNPRRRPSSVQGLLQVAVRNGKLPDINNLVDSYNLVSVRSGCSLGAHDADVIALPVQLRLIRGDETFTPLGSTESREIPPGEFAYIDAKDRVLCRLDVLQADFSKVTTATRNVLLIVEGTSANDETMLRQAYSDCIDLVLEHCGGHAEIVAFPY